MIYEKAEYTERPDGVRVEHLENGTNVWLHRDPVEVRTEGMEEGQPEQVKYVADTAFFFTQDRLEKEEIAADFDGWWAHAEAWTADQEGRTVEQRVNDMEAAFAALMRGDTE